MSDDKKASFKEFGQVSAEELERAIKRDQSYVELFKDQVKRDIEEQQDRRMLQLFKVVEQIDEHRQLRGHHDECEECPLSLSCLAGRSPGTWCASCVMHYNKELNLRIRCDALKETNAIHDLGACPVCDNGQKVDVFVGVRILDIETERELFGSNAEQLGLMQAAQAMKVGLKEAMSAPSIVRQIMPAIPVEEGDED